MTINTSIKKKVRGRPTLPDGADKSEVITLRATIKEKATWEQAASKTGAKLSEWIRLAITRQLGKKGSAR